MTQTAFAVNRGPLPIQQRLEMPKEPDGHADIVTTPASKGKKKQSHHSATSFSPPECPRTPQTIEYTSSF